MGVYFGRMASILRLIPSVCALRRVRSFGITSIEDYGLFQKNGFEVQDIILSIKIGDRSKFTIPQITNANVNTIVNDLTAYLNDENCKIGDKVTVEYRRYNSRGSNYTDHTLEFTVEQFIYGAN